MRFSHRRLRFSREVQMTIGELNVNREAWKDSIFELVVLGVLIAIVWVFLSL